MEYGASREVWGGDFSGSLRGKAKRGQETKKILKQPEEYGGRFGGFGYGKGLQGRNCRRKERGEGINRIATLAMLLDLVNNDKVILIPMDDAGQRSLGGKRFEWKSSANSLEANIFGSFANTKKRYPLLA